MLPLCAVASRLRRRGRSAVLCLSLLVLPTWEIAVAAGPFGGTVTSLLLADDAETPRWVSTTRGVFRHVDGRWHRVEPLGQGDFSQVLVTPTQLLVARTRGGLLGSRDDGATWSPVTEGLRGRYGSAADEVISLTQDPLKPRQLYLGAAGQGAFESRDGGHTWTLLAEGLEGQPAPAFHPTTLLPGNDERALRMGTGGLGLFAWDEGRWQPASSGLPPQLRVQRLVASAKTPLLLALATRGEGLWQSVDGGVSWTTLGRGRFGVVGAVAVRGTGEILAHYVGEGLLRVAGEERQFLRKLKDVPVRCLTPLRSGGWLAGLASDGLLELGADAEPKVARNLGMDATQILSTALGDTPSVLWAGDDNGVFRSSDHGRTWQSQEQGLPGAPVQALLRHGGRLFAGTGGRGVYRYDSEQNTWEPRFGGLGTSNTIYALTADAESGRLYVGTEGGVYRSDDQGGKWQRAAAGLPAASHWLVAASATRPGRVWCAGRGGLFTSADGGDNWRSLGSSATVDLFPLEREGREELLVVESRGLRRWGNEEPSTVALPLSKGERLQVVLPDPAGVGLWVGSTQGLWLVGPEQSRKVWDGAGVLVLRHGPEGRLYAGTDGRGVLTFRVGAF